VGLLVAPAEEPLLPLAGSALPPPVPPLAPELASEGVDVEGVPAAELPPELELSPVPAACSPELELSSLAPVAELEAVVGVDEVVEVEVVVVEVPCVASLSAWVLLGGVISGVLRGATSAVLPPPPQAPSVRA